MLLDPFHFWTRWAYMWWVIGTLHSSTYDGLDRSEVYLEDTVIR